MTPASIRIWFGRVKTSLRHLWKRLPSWLGRVRSWLRRQARRVMSWTGQEWLVVATLVIAGLGYWQWRYNNVLELQKLWASPEMMIRHQRLLDAQNCAYVPALLDNKSGAIASLKMVEPSEKYEGIERELPVYIEFFAEVESCIDVNLCDRVMACKRFGPQAVSLQQYYGEHLDRLRKTNIEDSYTSQFVRVAKLCGYGNRLRPQGSPEEAREQSVEINRMLNELRNKGPMVFRAEQACARMNPRRRREQSPVPE